MTRKRKQGTAVRSPLSPIRADHSGPVGFTGVTAGNPSLVYRLHRNPSQCCASNKTHQNLLDAAFTGCSGRCFATGSAITTSTALTTSTGTGTVAWVTAGLNRAAHNSRNAASHCDRYLARNALRASHSASLTNLTADRVRHLAGAGLLSHRAGCVRNLLGAAL